MEYHDIMNAYDAFHKVKGQLPDVLKESLNDVIVYADDTYVNHCEEVGMVAIAEIKDMEQNVINCGWDFIRNYSHHFIGSSWEEIEDAYRLYMEEHV